MQFLVDNSMYVTLIIALMTTVGLFIYLTRLDSRLRRLERKDQSL